MTTCFLLMKTVLMTVVSKGYDIKLMTRRAGSTSNALPLHEIHNMYLTIQIMYDDTSYLTRPTASIKFTAELFAIGDTTK